MDIWKQVRDVWEGMKTPSTLGSEVDYEGLIAELKRVAHAKRREIGERVYVPCDYLIELSPQNIADMREGNFASLMQDALQKAMEGHIRERKYLVQGAVTVRLGENDQLSDGYVAVTVSYSPQVPIQAAGLNAPRAPQKLPASEDRTVIHPLRSVSGPGAGSGFATESSASFEVLKGDATQQGKILELTTFPAVLGRITHSQTPPVGLVDATHSVGREHAVVEHKSGVFILEDRSQNGTWLNGVKLRSGEKAELVDGAEVALAGGAIVLRFHSGERTVLQRSVRGTG